MKANINRCDICGADDAPDNRVNARLTRPGKARSDGSPFASMFSFSLEPSEDVVDLCQQCSAGVLDILRAKEQRRKKAEQAKPAPQSDFAVLLKALLESEIVLPNAFIKPDIS